MRALTRGDLINFKPGCPSREILGNGQGGFAKRRRGKKRDYIKNMHILTYFEFITCNRSLLLEFLMFKLVTGSKTLKK